MKDYITRCLVLLLLFGSIDTQAQDPLLDILKQELNREFSELNKQEVPTYYLSYRVGERTNIDIVGSFGCLERFAGTKFRQLTTQIRVGSPELDNFHEIKGASMGIASSRIQLPVENSVEAIRQILWQNTNENYFQAIQKLTQIKASRALNVPDEDKSIDFEEASPVQYFEPKTNTDLDKGFEEKLKNKVRLYSKAFALNNDITTASVRFQIVFGRDYFVSTEGAEIVENNPSVNLFITGNALAEDGMDLSLYKTYFVTDLKDLPKDEVVLAEINSMINKLTALKKAPVVDPYSGPALLSGEASGVFFHEIFGHRVEAARMKSENDAQTFLNKVGQQVLNKSISVIFDPSITVYKGFKLSGSYMYDDEGTKGKRVEVVRNGILTDFLTNRTPIKNFPHSNGHGRGQLGFTPVARQSNLIVESDQSLSESDLRKLFKEELRKQNLPFGFYFKSVYGGFTMTNRVMPNAFNIYPLEVYRIFADEKADELVRGINLVGTPLAMFSEIEAVGGALGHFAGTCGAESGGVPVSSVCPMMMVKKIEIQKRQKSGNTKPILDRPF